MSATPRLMWIVPDECGPIPSCVLWSANRVPPSLASCQSRSPAHGVPKTAGAAFEELSAVSATVADVRAVLARARYRLGGSGQRTILFLDEIHLFNKAQQDALLPAVEEGLVTLIGATTENPYFEVNSALLSRSQIYELVPLSDEELELIVRRGAEALGVDMSDELRMLVARRAGGAARN